MNIEGENSLFEADQLEPRVRQAVEYLRNGADAAIELSNTDLLRTKPVVVKSPDSLRNNVGLLVKGIFRPKWREAERKQRQRESQQEMETKTRVQLQNRTQDLEKARDRFRQDVSKLAARIQEINDALQVLRDRMDFFDKEAAKLLGEAPDSLREKTTESIVSSLKNGVSAATRQEWDKEFERKLEPFFDPESRECYGSIQSLSRSLRDIEYLEGGQLQHYRNLKRGCEDFIRELQVASATGKDMLGQLHSYEFPHAIKANIEFAASWEQDIQSALSEISRKGKYTRELNQEKARIRKEKTAIWLEEKTRQWDDDVNKLLPLLPEREFLEQESVTAERFLGIYTEARKLREVLLKQMEEQLLSAKRSFVALQVGM